MRFVSKKGEDSVKVLDIMLFKIHEFKKEDVTDFTIKWELHKGEPITYVPDMDFYVIENVDILLQKAKKWEKTIFSFDDEYPCALRIAYNLYDWKKNDTRPLPNERYE